MGVRLIFPPVPVEPLTLPQLKAALRVDHSDDDAVLTQYEIAAREFVETRIQSKIALATYEFVIDGFPAAEIMLPFQPVVSVVSIKYDDANGDEQIIPSNTYELDSVNRDAWVFSDVAWPATVAKFNAVRITFLAGYQDPTQLAPPLVSAIILKVKELYDGENTAQAVHDLLTNYYRMVA